MSKLPVPTAKEINDAHAYAKECADTAIEHAVLCGKLLAKKKDSMPHGEFTDWVEQWCKFSPRTARKYMQVADQAKQNGMLMPFSTMDKLLGYEKPASKPNTPKGAAPVVKAPADKPEATGGTGTDRPAAPTSPPAATESPPPVEGEPERPDAADEDAALEAAEQDFQERIARVVESDDVLRSMRDELRKQSGEIVALKASRDHYMRQAGEAARLVKVRDREIAKLKRGRQAA